MKKGYFELEYGEKIEFELYEEEAPNTVKNFVDLINDNFYDVLTFYRLIPAFISLEDCAYSTFIGGSDKSFKCEIEDNPHILEAGSLSIAYARKYSGSSPFFIVH